MAIVVSDLEYVHPGGGLLFSGVSFRVGDREHAALIGVNGVGKSTLLRLLTKELQPTQGAVQIDGRLQFMPQQIGRMYDSATVVATGSVGTSGADLNLSTLSITAGQTVSCSSYLITEAET